MPRCLRRSRLAVVLAPLLAVLTGVGGVAAATALPASGGRSGTLPALRGGAVLHADGTVVSFGDVAVNTTGAPSWPGVDFARSLALLPDGSGGWELDRQGGLHAFGAAPNIPAPAAWPGGDAARALVVLADRASGFVLDAWGGLHAFGPAPGQVTQAPALPGGDAVGLELLPGPGGAVGGAVLDAAGSMHPLSGTTGLQAPPLYYGHAAYVALHADGGAVYAVERYGGVVPLSPGIVPRWTGYADTGAADQVRDVVLLHARPPAALRPSPAQPQSGQAVMAFQAAVADLRPTLLPVPLLRQVHSLDCEAAALQAALAERGTGVSQDWVLGVIGSDRRAAITDASGNVLHWGDPFATFVGDVNGSEPNFTGYGVYDPPIATAATVAGHPAIGGEGWSAGQVYAHVAAGHPVIVWLDATFEPVSMRTWVAWDGRSVPYAVGEHAVVLAGFDPVAGTVTLMDVAEGVNRVFPMSRFEAAWGSFGRMAVAVG